MILHIEIVLLEKNLIRKFEPIIHFLNEAQDSFNYSILKDDEMINNWKGSSDIKAEKIYNQLDDLRNKIKGYHPILVCATSKHLYNNRLSNLFGTTERDKNGLPTGNGIFTTFQVKEIIREMPIEFYLIHECLMFGISSLIKKYPFHSESRHCIYDLKVDKTSMYAILRHSNICLDCYNIIRRHLDIDQVRSIKKVFNLLSDASYERKSINELLELKIDEPKNIISSITINEAESFLKQDKLKNAIELLSEIVREKDMIIYNELILIYAKLSDLDTKERIDIYRFEEMNVLKNKIRYSILQILNEVKNIGNKA